MVLVGHVFLPLNHPLSQEEQRSTDPQTSESSAPMDNISPEDEFAVVFASASLYGIYLISFVQCLRWQLLTGKGWTIMWRWNRTTVNIVLVIFALTTAYVSLGLYKSRRLVYATVHNTRTSAPGLQPWFSVAIVSKH